ncbi:MAG: cobalamin-dependent protein [Planctomycetes bacterium]|nr:cobalamin-dependent protein [Planctomycetota bacterium]
MLAQLAEAIRSHRPESIAACRALAERALAAGVPAARIVDAALIPAMADVGRRFRADEIFVPEVLVSAKAMQGALDVLEPALADAGREPFATIVLGTVQGDVHDIGKNLVAMMLRGAGLRVVDLGVNVAPQRFVAAIDAHRPELVGLSALLTTTMDAMRATLDAIVAAGQRDRVRVLVGGAPVTAAWAMSIGADGHADDAAEAATVALRLLGR